MYLAVSILSGELDAKPAGTEIRRRFLAFLSRAPLVNLFNILLGDTTEKKWSVWNSQGRGNHEAILSWPESEEAPSAWAKVILPDPWLVDLDDVTFVTNNFINFCTSFRLVWHNSSMAKKGRRATEDERIQAIQLIESGRKIDDVTEIMGVGRRTVLEWWEKYRRGGLAELSTKFASGRPTSLSDRQMLELRAIIVGTDPRQLSFGLALWTRGIIRELIRRRFGITLSQVTVGRILKKLGMSPQRPLYRAYQQNPERVREWKEKTYPEIRKEAAERGAVIFFADEAGVRTDFHSGTTWAPIGQTPVVTATGKRESIMMVSAVSPRGELRFHIHEGSFRAAHFVEFCKQLLKDVDSDIFLIVDGSSVHTAGETKEFVESTRGKLSLFFLPGYSPELNPDEWVWKNVKHDTIGRSGVRGLDDLKAVAVSSLRHLQKMPGKVRGFFADPKLTYIFR